MQAVVGARKFDRLSLTHSLSKFVFISDEAFALLIYENQEDRWWEMHCNGTTKSTTPAKFTDGGRSSKLSGRSRLGKGWDYRGIDRFNKLCELVQKDRRSSHAQKFEEDCMAHRSKMRDGKGGRGKNREKVVHEDDDKVPTTVFHEMGGMMQLEEGAVV